MPVPEEPAAAHSPPRTLSEVLAAVGAQEQSAYLAVPAGADRAEAEATRVDGLGLATAAMRPGALFVALPGARRHGAEFTDVARAAGARAVLSDRPAAALPTVVVRDPRAVLGPLAAWMHGRPSEHLAVHGVTGTNGKTSTCMLLVAGLVASGRRPAWSTSLEVATPDGSRPATLTTPEAPAVQAHLAAARTQGADDAVLEVSSHGLALDRVAGTHFRTGVFTNLSTDHLDLHSDLESYYTAKASLFAPERCDLAVVNVDDEYGRRLVGETRCPVVTVSSCGRAADWWVEEVRADEAGTRFRLRGPGVDVRGELRLRGAYQADNAALAVAALASDGVDPGAALRGMADVAVAGRLEPVDAGQPFTALVDFAHNVGGYDRLLPYLRSLAQRRLLVVAGITGEKDVSVRARVGAHIARAADLFVVTDESAHDDDPAALRRALVDEARRVGGAEVVEVADRAEALARAVAAAGPGDVVAVVGRGAEQVQESTDGVVPFDDRAELHRALAAVWGERSTPEPTSPLQRPGPA